MQEKSPPGPNFFHGFSKAYAQFLSLESSFGSHVKYNKVWFPQFLGKRRIVPQMTMLTCTKTLDMET
jgi:hypothetical protein